MDVCEEKANNHEPIEEIQKYFFKEVQALGPKERLNNLYRIRPKRSGKGSAKGLQFFKLNAMQNALIDNIQNRNLVLKMRQGGVTTFSCIYALDMALWNEGSHTAIMAHVRENVKKFFRIIKNAFNAFQRDWGTLYPVSTTIDNVNELKINETGSELTVCTEAKGLTLDFLHISEAAFVEDDRISESIEAVPMSGTVVLETTPNTASGFFYDLWYTGEFDDFKSFTNHFYPWWYQYPEPGDITKEMLKKKMNLSDKEKQLMKAHDLELAHIIWRRIKISECGGDEGEFARKYPEDPLTCFLAGTQSYFEADIMMSHWKNEKTPVFVGELEYDDKKLKFIERSPGKLKEFCGWKVWQKPEKVRTYAIGADVAEGVGKDASVASVVDVKTGVVVAQYWSDIADIDTFAAELYKGGKYYNTAHMIVECNNVGHGVLAHLGGQVGGLKYPKLYRRYELDEYTQKKTKKLGWKTTRGNKAVIIGKLKSALRDGKLTIFDKYSLQELSSFVRDLKTGKLGAESKGGSHDDRVMSMALTWEQVLLLRQSIQYTESTKVPQFEYNPETGAPIGFR